MIEFIERTKPTNKKHIRNLLKLADFLETHVPPPRFNMSSYFTSVNEKEIETNKETITNLYDDDVSSYVITNGYGAFPDEMTPSKYHCGAVACAVGHGPLAGIGKSKLKSYRNWEAYAADNFGAGYLSEGSWSCAYDYPENSNYAWFWMFDSQWRYVDNTPQGAAARIRMYVENGLPEDYHASDYTKNNLPYVAKPYTPPECKLPGNK